MLVWEHKNWLMDLYSRLSGTKSEELMQRCLSKIFIPDPGLIFYPYQILDLGFRIPDPKSSTKEMNEKKLAVMSFL
jgi:hypothetical protein